VGNHHADTEFFGNMTGNMLGTVDLTVLPAGTAATHLDMGKTASLVCIDHIVHKRVCIL
jgi:hypothetical protein